jgi:hypothetical protein
MVISSLPKERLLVVPQWPRLTQHGADCLDAGRVSDLEGQDFQDVLALPSESVERRPAHSKALSRSAGPTAARSRTAVRIILISRGLRLAAIAIRSELRCSVS